ncbi:MAG: EAL domain-containing response regulator [Polyangiaceae bacterium]
MPAVVEAAKVVVGAAEADAPKVVVDAPKIAVEAPKPSVESPKPPARVERELSSVLLVDDDVAVLRAMGRSLRSKGYNVVTAHDGEDAVRQIAEHAFDVILSDISMPGIDGIQLLRQVREHDLNVPVILITGEPAVRTAVQALEYGAFHYLTKPVGPDALEAVLEKAVRVHRMARIKQQAAELLGNANALGADRAGIEASFDRALQQLWVAYQPIVDPRTQSVFGYEALLRTSEPSLPHPGAVLDAATRLGRLEELGRIIRNRAAGPMLAAPDAGRLFVNLHVTDLLDPLLSSPNSPLAAISTRVVLEITERSSLDEVRDVRARVAALEEMGYSIAVDDLGAGYAGLTSFTLLEPEIVKLDMSLIRDAHQNSTKQKVVRSMTALAKDMGMIVVAEGVESPAERDVLVELGCDYLQGFLFARPGPAFPEVKW